MYNYGCVVLPWHFKFYILKCKNFLIGFLDELDNFKQKNPSEYVYQRRKFCGANDFSVAAAVGTHM